MDKDALEETTRILQRQWGLPDQAQPDWERLRLALRGRLQELLEDDFSSLVNAMYRLDVQESRFKAALAAGTVPEIAAELADIVLERELKRLETRNKYRKTDQDPT